MEREEIERDFDNGRIFSSFMRIPSNYSTQFYGDIESELSLLTGQVKSTSKWSPELIPKIKKYNNVHYLCPKCLQFPLIDFISKKFIFYNC